MALGLASALSGCGVLPLGLEVGRGVPTESETSSAEREAPSPTVAVASPEDLDLVQAYFPGARSLLSWEDMEDSNGFVVPNTRIQRAAAVAVERWRASPSNRRPGELLLSVKRDHPGSTPFLVFLEVVSLVPDFLVGLPPLVELRDDDVELTLEDAEGRIVASAATEGGGYLVGTVAFTFRYLKHSPFPPSLPRAVHGLLVDLERRGAEPSRNPKSP
ncbi:MAG TPA: hypothetical protein VFF73_04610 [Planctomycetota bacterium]|nr:hypothetical protein [Planctomycetota bacterium]